MRSVSARSQGDAREAAGADTVPLPKLQCRLLRADFEAACPRTRREVVRYIRLPCESTFGYVIISPSVRFDATANQSPTLNPRPYHVRGNSNTD